MRTAAEESGPQDYKFSSTGTEALKWTMLLFTRQPNWTQLLFSLIHGTMISISKQVRNWHKRAHKLSYLSERTKEKECRWRTDDDAWDS